ncbi:hypothetical protein PQ692_05090 [Thermoanaerobacterium thermosaccharolyticum]|uniref:ABC transporter permease n=2 Tax=Thermoanaerobacterium thermosaccharolyticum TaxID=1517 RepID=UPI003DA9D36C
MKSIESEKNYSLGKFQERRFLVSRYDIKKLLSVILIIIPYIIFNIFTKGRFMESSNILSILVHAVVPAFVAWGFCFIFTSGIMDLSIGAIMILACIVSGILAIKIGYFGLILGGILVSFALEYINLKCMIKTKIPSWVFGLGMAMIYEAIGALYGASQLKLGKQVVSLGVTARKLGSIPWIIIVLALGLIMAYIIFNRTSIGFDIRAVGSNREVAKMMGVDVTKAIIRGGLVGSVFIGLASAINESYAGRVMPTTGLNSIALIFIPLAVYLLAQAFEQIFNLTVAVIISSVIVESLFNILTILGVPSGTWQQVAVGACVIVCGVLAQRHYKGVVK